MSPARKSFVFASSRCGIYTESTMSMNLRPRRRPVPTIPIVSLIDIMVILLIFFVGTTSFKRQRTTLEVQLPSSKSLGTTGMADETRWVLTLTKANEVFLNGKPTPVEQLEAALGQVRKDQPSAKFELEADAAASLGSLVRVWDSLKAAGISIAEVPARLNREGGG
jgi:biopolymer transport protein ExbD